MMTSWQIAFRSALRRVGVLRLVRQIEAWPRRRRLSRYREEFEHRKPPYVSVDAGPMTVKIRPLDGKHFAELHVLREPKVLHAILAAVCSGDVAWDVGANIGYFTLILARAVGRSGRVVAFEPEPRSREELYHNTRLNQLDNVEIHPVALGDEEAVARMEASPTPAAGNHRLLPGGAAVETGERVDVLPGDAFRTRQRTAVPNLVKIDVEGAEEAVLRGLRNTLSDPACRAVICEVHFALLESQGRRDAPLEIRDFLGARGFERFCWVDSSHLLAQKSSAAKRSSR